LEGGGRANDPTDGLLARRPPARPRRCPSPPRCVARSLPPARPPGLEKAKAIASQCTADHSHPGQYGPRRPHSGSSSWTCGAPKSIDMPW